MTTASADAELDRLDRVTATITGAHAHLRDRQASAGWWKGELRTNVTMDAEDLLMRQFLGILTTDELERSARWIRSQQRDDGTWATFAGGPGDLSTTIEAYTALRLAGDGRTGVVQRAAAGGRNSDDRRRSHRSARRRRSVPRRGSSRSPSPPVRDPGAKV